MRVAPSRRRAENSARVRSCSSGIRGRSAIAARTWALRLLGGRLPEGPLCGGQQMADGVLRVAGLGEMPRELGCRLRRGGAVGVLEPQPDAAVDSGPLSPGDVLVQRLLTEVVGERVPRRDRPVGPPLLAPALDERAALGQLLEDGLGVALAAFGTGGGKRRCELGAGDARRSRISRVDGSSGRNCSAMSSRSESGTSYRSCSSRTVTAQRSPSCSTAPPSSQESTSCSTKSGTPRVRRVTSSTRSPGSSWPGRRRSRYSVTATAESGPTATSEQRLRSRREWASPRTRAPSSPARNVPDQEQARPVGAPGDRVDERRGSKGRSSAGPRARARPAPRPRARRGTRPSLAASVRRHAGRATIDPCPARPRRRATGAGQPRRREAASCATSRAAPSSARPSRPTASRTGIYGSPSPLLSTHWPRPTRSGSRRRRPRAPHRRGSSCRPRLPGHEHEPPLAGDGLREHRSTVPSSARGRRAAATAGAAAAVPAPRRAPAAGAAPAARGERRDPAAGSAARGHAGVRRLDPELVVEHAPEAW